MKAALLASVGQLLFGFGVVVAIAVLAIAWDRARTRHRPEPTAADRSRRVPLHVAGTLPVDWRDRWQREPGYDPDRTADVVPLQRTEPRP